jgi:Tol biopolymer transport system component
MESSQAAWSPDGEKIAYMVRRVGAYQVWTMNEDGQEALQLTRSGQELWDYLPAWTPDGRTVFFNQRRLGAFRPWLMRIDYGGENPESQRMNFVTPIEDVTLSPDGLWLAFEGMDGEGNRDIYFMTIAGSGRTRLTNDPNIDFDPAWRPLQN